LGGKYFKCFGLTFGQNLSGLSIGFISVIVHSFTKSISEFFKNKTIPGHSSLEDKEKERVKGEEEEKSLITHRKKQEQE
jgi:hypothetical protein